MTGSESRETWKPDTGGKIFKAAAEGKVQAMQLKLFIEISVLKKHEKPRYKATARKACEENTWREIEREGSHGAGY